jgi:hypothetical protein
VVANDKPRGVARRAAPKGTDPRNDDLSGNGHSMRNRVRVPRPQPNENPLDKVPALETSPPSSADAAPFVAANRQEPADLPGTAQVLLAPPLASVPAPVEQPSAPVVAPFAAPRPASPPTDAMPAVGATSAAALLDLGGRSSGADTGPKTETVERVLAPLAQLRPASKPVGFRKARRPRIRRVTRVVRHVDTWSVFKVAFVFNLVVYVVCLTAAVLLWNVAYSTGTIDNIENFFEQFGWESFEFRGGELFHNLWVAGLFVTVGLTGLAVLVATLFNLITDLVGGIRVTVLEEEVVARPASRGVARSRDLPTSSSPALGTAPPTS